MVSSIVIIGPAWPLRGGLSAFDEQLARTFKALNINTRIETFSLQYPSFLFPGTSQYSNESSPIDVNIHIGINSINPFNWLKIGLKITEIQESLMILNKLLIGLKKYLFMKPEIMCNGFSKQKKFIRL